MGDSMERLTKREGKHTIRIGNEWRRHDPVWERLAYYEDLLKTLQLPDYLVLVPDEDGTYRPAIIESRNDDGTVIVIMSNNEYEVEI